MIQSELWMSCNDNHKQIISVFESICESMHSLPFVYKIKIYEHILKQLTHPPAIMWITVDWVQDITAGLSKTFSCHCLSTSSLVLVEKRKQGDYHFCFMIRFPVLITNKNWQAMRKFTSNYPMIHCRISGHQGHSRSLWC